MHVHIYFSENVTYKKLHVRSHIGQCTGLDGDTGY